MLTNRKPPEPEGVARSATDGPVFDALFGPIDRRVDDDVFELPEWLLGSEAPAADVWETPNELVLKVDLPGYDPKSLRLEAVGNVLTIWARPMEDAPRHARWLQMERVHEPMERSFPLSRAFDAGGSEAHYENGVLTVTVPKRAGAKPRNIAVTTED